MIRIKFIKNICITWVVIKPGTSGILVLAWPVPRAKLTFSNTRQASSSDLICRSRSFHIHDPGECPIQAVDLSFFGFDGHAYGKVGTGPVIEDISEPVGDRPDLIDPNGTVPEKETGEIISVHEVPRCQVSFSRPGRTSRSHRSRYLPPAGHPQNTGSGETHDRSGAG